RIIDPEPVDATSTQPLSLHRVLRRHTGGTSGSDIVVSIRAQRRPRSGAPAMASTTQPHRRQRATTKESRAGRGAARGQSPLLGNFACRRKRRQGPRKPPQAAVTPVNSDDPGLVRPGYHRRRTRGNPWEPTMPMPAGSVDRRRLRTVLRRERETARMTQDQVAVAMDWSLSKIIRIESGTVSISTNDLRALLDLYDVSTPEQKSELVALARAVRR